METKKIEFRILNNFSVNSALDSFSFDPSETVIKVIPRYLRERGINISINSGKLSFLVGRTGSQTNLAESRYYDKKMSELVRDGDLLIMGGQMREDSQMYDEEAFDFADLRSSPIQIGFSNDAPEYRTIDKGLNIFGICKTKKGKCKASGDTVIVCKGMGNFELGKIINDADLPCPVCENCVKSYTCGFYKCKYKIYGRIVEDNIVKNLDTIEGEARNENSCTYYQPDLQNVRYIDLTFETKELND